MLAATIRGDFEVHDGRKRKTHSTQQLLCTVDRAADH
jgi:hypothetical protein